MAFSITQVIYEWMHEKRIVTAVAQEMRSKEGTLLGEAPTVKSTREVGGG